MFGALKTPHRLWVLVSAGIQIFECEHECFQIPYNIDYPIDDGYLREFRYLNANMNMFGSPTTLIYLIDDGYL